MKNDITRDTFNPLKHFSRVLSQQGRVQLDADWNEQVSILLQYLRTLTADLVGPGAGPEAECGFDLLATDKDIQDLKLSAPEEKALTDRLAKEGVLIAPGRYYVDGWLAENQRFVPFLHQPGWAVPKDDQDEIEKGTVKAVVYLDVWEQHITPIEDDDIREKALGGPDTATRAKIAWAVRARRLTDEETKAVTGLPANPTPKNLAPLAEAFEGAKLASPSRGLLKAQIAPQEAGDDECAATPESIYRGPENQLYRIEIHRGGLASDGTNKPATFKWSRDNGSVAAAWLDTDGDVLKVTALHDEARGFSKGQWVELHDDRYELEGRRGTLVQLKDVEAGSLTIDPATASGSVDRSHFKSNPKVRRWDQEEKDEIKLYKGAIPIVEGEWIKIEDGVEIQFQKSAEAGKPHQYRTGDYWLIPARVATRDIEWPWERDARGEIVKDDKGEAVRLALPPHGVTHHYAVLGLLAATALHKFEFTDCRRKFAPLRESP